MFILRTQHFVFSTLIAVCVFASAATAVAQEANVPDAPVIVPTDGISAERWYTGVPGSFSWEVPDDVTAVAVEMGSTPDHEPLFVYEPPISRYTPPAAEMTEGVQYVSVQFLNANGWGEIAHYPVRIDRTPPTDLFIDIIDQSIATSTLVFGANDALSGIAGYALHVNGSEPLYLSPEAAQRGHSFTHPYPGKFDVQVIAYDNAGNSTFNRFPVYVLDQSPVPAELWLGMFTDAEMTAIGLGILALFLVWYALRTRSYYRWRERKLRDEMYDVQEQMAKIFAALRDEIYDQIQSIRARKRMTKGEQQVVENLNSVLEVSETLVNKEVEDVKKILK